MIDTVCQICIFVIAPTALLLKACKVWWAPAVGILQQPFWFATTYFNQQWVLMGVTTVFTFIWLYSCYSWMIRPWLLRRRATHSPPPLPIIVAKGFLSRDQQEWIRQQAVLCRSYQIVLLEDLWEIVRRLAHTHAIPLTGEAPFLPCVLHQESQVDVYFISASILRYPLTPPLQ